MGLETPSLLPKPCSCLSHVFFLLPTQSLGCTPRYHFVGIAASNSVIQTSSCRLVVPRLTLDFPIR